MNGNIGIIAGSIILFIVVIVAVYIFLIYGEKVDKEKSKWLTKTKFAHRGLYSKNQSLPENSIAAFKKAIDNNYGIEFDVSFTKDKHTVIFHDDNLYRMTGVDKLISDCTLEELNKLTLKDTKYKIPTFKEVLRAVDGTVPLIIEIKSNKDRNGLCKAVENELRDYKGNYCIESFDPLIMNIIKKNMPDVIRGQLSMRYTDEEKLPKILKFALENLLLNYKSRPHFIAYNWRDSNKISLRLLKRLGIITVAWTINSDEAIKVGNNNFDAVIFEHCIPEKI